MLTVAALLFAAALPVKSDMVAGHIPGARFIHCVIPSRADGEESPADGRFSCFGRSAGVDENAIVITYCRTGMEASVTYFVLRYLGRDVTLYDGSFIEWSAADDTVVVSDAARARP